MNLQLPPLREELAIQEGPRAHDGQPGWTLHDPSRNRFFRLDWLTFEILQRWSLRDPGVIARHITEHTPLKATAGDIDAVLRFLAQNHLLHLAGAPLSGDWAALHARGRQTGLRWLVMNYLFFRVPLVRPERLLVWLERRMQFLFRPWFWRVTALAAVAGMVLVARQWDQFAGTWTALADFSGLLGFLAIIVGVKICHEFGHGLAATHYGCRVPAMGVAFLVLTPVAYTDVNEAWNLKERRPRLCIGAAGMITELLLAAWATLAWGLLPDGTLRSIAFMLATTTWVKSLLINASPVMRFDGYYLLSDALDLPNLHARCFALARWRLREMLFGLGEQPPEHFTRRMRRGLVALGVFIWLYRLVVFLGIAVFVYYFFFKALGIVLFTVEIIWFVLLPIGEEMKVWHEKRDAILRSPRTRWTAAVVLALLMLTAVPLPQRVRLMGELAPVQELRLVAPDSARLVELPVADGARIAAGQPLLRLDSQAVRQRLERARIRVERVEAEMKTAELDASHRARLPTMEAALVMARAALREAEVNLEQLTPNAPFAGVLRRAAGDVQVGEVVERDELLATLVGDGAWQVTAYLDERDLHLVTPGTTARFYPAGQPHQPVEMRVTAIERDAARVIAHPLLADQSGGNIPTRLVDGELVPLRASYRLRLEATAVDPQLATQTRVGKVVIHAGHESLLARGARAVMSVLWREAGF